MPTLYVARSPKLSDWASDVGLGKHVYKVGVTDDDPAALAARGWAGETDWAVLAAQDAGDVTEEQALERLAKREKPVDPTYYPRLKGAAGVFKVQEANVNRHILLGRALAGESERTPLKIKAADIAKYLLTNALG